MDLKHAMTELKRKSIFKSVSSAQETDTPTQTTHHQLSGPGNSNTSDLEAVPEPELIAGNAYLATM